MNQFNNSNNINQQLILDMATRKNYYNIAKWFNLASFIWSAIMFFVFLILTITASKAMKQPSSDASLVASKELYIYVFMVIACLTNSIVSYCLWLYTKKLSDAVGTAQETSHIAFGVFTFLFANWISGIFILLGSSSFNRAQILINLISQQATPSLEE